MKSSTFKINILIFVAIISCTLAISTPSQAQGNSNFRVANNIFSLDLLRTLFSSILGSRDSYPARATSPSTNAIDNVPQKKSTGDFVPRTQEEVVPKTGPGCGGRCGNGESNA
jgi:hypothetical protein